MILKKLRMRAFGKAFDSWWEAKAKRNKARAFAVHLIVFKAASQVAPGTTVHVIDCGEKATEHKFRIFIEGTSAEANGVFPAEWLLNDPLQAVARIVSYSGTVGYANELLAKRAEHVINTYA